jgi:hypothetical protein
MMRHSRNESVADCDSETDAEGEEKIFTRRSDRTIET